MTRRVEALTVSECVNSSRSITSAGWPSSRRWALPLIIRRPLSRNRSRRKAERCLLNSLHFADGRQCFLTLVGWPQPCRFCDL
jgi:hypothetical protein